MTRTVASERVVLGNIDSDDTSSEELLCLCDSIQEATHGLAVHLPNLFDGKVAYMLPMGVAERRPLPIGLVDEAPSTLIDGQILTESEVRLEIPVGVLVDLTPLASAQ
ncbi:hypothetical protein SAMN05192554_14110 [Haloarchaeobius iranensis]|uniref:Uncharacterized protein n=1 Tax=Haloarchaeobius iranensis TaxID=996166 RepID=A0A1H0BIR8_9EURY|nr:hypothetical protein SAMN05192554_14110 [Haloarchaeobius iranensis]